MRKKFDAYDGLSFFGGLVFFAPVALLVRTQAGVSESLFFLLQALLSIVMFLGEVPAGLLTDRIGYRRSLVLSQFLILAARILMLLAYLLRRPWLFALEAVVFGIACCFSSGTADAYVYEVYGKNNYLPKSAQAANCGSAGFILSTLLYALLYKAVGISGLLAATVLSSAAAAALSLGLTPEKTTASAQRAAPSPAQLFLVLKHGKVLVALSAALSVTGLLVTFFYAEKLRSCGVSLEWMSPIIFGYSLIQMLSKGILVQTASVNRERLLGTFCGLAALVLICFGFTDRAAPVIVMMLLLPLLCSIPGYCLSQQENTFVDRFFGGENRAANLSVLNMGVNLVEILALFASAALTGLSVGLCFLAVGLVLLGFGIFFLAKAA